MNIKAKKRARLYGGYAESKNHLSKLQRGDLGEWGIQNEGIKIRKNSLMSNHKAVFQKKVLKA